MDTGAATRDEHGRDGEAGIGVGDGAIGSRIREHPQSDNEKGRSIASMEREERNDGDWRGQRHAGD